MRTGTSILACALLAPGLGFADNPIVQTNYTADPAPMAYKDTMFVYTGHDEDGATYFTMNEWRVYSSTDMVNWTDRGAPLNFKTFKWAKGDAWAAQCVERDGKFYWYVTLSHSSGGAPAVGVAVSNSPTGPFVDALGKALVGPSWDGYIDPTAFIDTDGQAYMYWGNPGLWYVKLNKDMISYSGGIQTIPLTTASFGTRTGDAKRATLYEEAPWFFKRDKLYYMVFAGGPLSEHISYSTSPNPTGPWTYKGVVMPTQGSSFTNHPGIADLKGKSYFFFHNGALPGGGGFTRSVGVEEFAFNADGTIPKFGMTNLGVTKPVHNLNPYLLVEGETMAFSKGLKVGLNASSGIYVTQIHNNDYIKVRAVDFGTSGALEFTANLASSGSGGTIELHLDTQTGKSIGTLAVSGTGGATTWKKMTTAVTGATGVHDLFFVFKGGAGELFNLDSWQFSGGNTGVIPHSIPQRSSQTVDVHTPSGERIRSRVTRDKALDGLKNGVYFVGEDRAVVAR